MGRENVSLVAFNRGLISPLGLARVDLDRTRLSAEIQTNWTPRVLGSMMLRPGFEYIATQKDSNTARFVPFVYATDDTAYIEISDVNARIYVDDAPISRTAVSTSITNGDFSNGITSWTDTSGTGATAASGDNNTASLTGTGAEHAGIRQLISVAAGDQSVLHGLRIDITRGPVYIRIGSTAGGNQYYDGSLGTGLHSLAIRPTGDFYVEFQSHLKYSVLVNSIEIESSGTQDLTAPWLEADLDKIRTTQSADVIYVACEGYKQHKFIRRGTTSWSLVEYEPQDGPFRTINLSDTTMYPSALSGDVVLTANDDTFKDSHVGALFRVDSIGQSSSVDASGADQWSNSIRVTGVDNSRIFDIDISGTFVGTVTVQRSVAVEGNWEDVPNLSYTGTTTTTHDDALDNQIIYYRIGINTGDYTSGTATCTLSYGSGSNYGICRITNVQSETVADVVTLKDFGGLDASSIWYEGQWSDFRGWPSAVAMHESRLAWAGKSKINLSATDAFETFGDDIEGDSAPISRTIGEGPVDNINWLLSGTRLLLGTDSAEPTIRSSSFDEPLTPSAFNIKYPSTQGSSQVAAVKLDDSGIHVQRGGEALYKLSYSSETYDYSSQRITTLAPEVGSGGIVRLAVQRQPDNRILAVRADGKIAMLVHDPAEDVNSWVMVHTDGVVEDVWVLPSGGLEDYVYISVKRVINGNTVRYIERLAFEDDCQGGTISKQLDSHLVYSGSSTTSITGLDHLEAETVRVWGRGAKIDDKTISDGKITGLQDYNGRGLVIRNVANDADYGIYAPDESGEIIDLDILEGETVEIRETGKYLGEYTVSSGAITLSEATTDCVVGLKYIARYKSTKLAYAAKGGTALTQTKIVNHMGMIMRNTHKNGVSFGTDFGNLESLVDSDGGEQALADDFLFVEYDKKSTAIFSTWDTDKRLCIQAESPYPVTVLAATLGIQTNEKY